MAILVAYAVRQRYQRLGASRASKPRGAFLARPGHGGGSADGAGNLPPARRGPGCLGVPWHDLRGGFAQESCENHSEYPVLHLETQAKIQDGLLSKKFPRLMFQAWKMTFGLRGRSGTLASPGPGTGWESRIDSSWIGRGGCTSWRRFGAIFQFLTMTVSAAIVS